MGNQQMRRTTCNELADMGDGTMLVGHSIGASVRD
jgi:hypothetical protein